MTTLQKKRRQRMEAASGTKSQSRCAQTRRCLRTECLVTVVILAVLAMFVTWNSSAIVKSGYELVKVRTELTIMEQSSENLRLDISMLKSPQRIQQIATNSLGMIIPPNVYMSSSKPAKAKTGDETKEVVRGSSNPLAFLWLGKAEAHSSR